MPQFSRTNITWILMFLRNYCGIFKLLMNSSKTINTIEIVPFYYKTNPRHVYGLGRNIWIINYDLLFVGDINLTYL